MSIIPLNLAEREAAQASLRADPKLAGYPPTLLTMLLDACEWRRFPSGTRLFTAGDNSSQLHAVASGFVGFESSLAVPDLAMINLMKAPFWLVGRPQVQGQIRLNTADARSDLIVGTVSTTRFDALAAIEPALHNFKARVALDMFFEALEALTDALIFDNRIRLISTLLRIAGSKRDSDSPTSVPISQTELSALTKLSRQTCGEMLRGFERDGVVRLGYREIEVLQAARLRAMIV